MGFEAPGFRDRVSELRGGGVLRVGGLEGLGNWGVGFEGEFKGLGLVFFWI